MTFKTPERTQKAIDIVDNQTIKLWMVNNMVLQFLERLAPEKIKYQVLVIE